MPGDNPRLPEALPKKDHFHYPLNMLVFSIERRTLCICSEKVFGASFSLSAKNLCEWTNCFSVSGWGICLVVGGICLVSAWLSRRFNRVLTGYLPLKKIEYRSLSGFGWGLGCPGSQ